MNHPADTMNNEQKIIFDGTWEKPGRSIVLAAIIIVLLCGGIFQVAPSLLFAAYQLIDARTNGLSGLSDSGDFIELMKALYERYKYPLLITTIVSQFVIFLGLTVTLTRRWHTKNVIKYFQYNRFNPVFFALALVGAFCVLPIVEFFEYLVSLAFPVLDRLSEISLPIFKTRNPADLAFTLAAISLTPAICEEALFRGYFQRTLQRKVRTPWHFIVSGVFFGLFHQQPLSLPVLILIGVFFGFVYYSAGSIYPTMICHFTYNTLILLLLNNRELFSVFLSKDGSFTSPVTIASAVLFSICIAAIHFYSKRRNTDKGAIAT
jgi:membrane protease YdiL (CAAX protease family)